MTLPEKQQTIVDTLIDDVKQHFPDEIDMIVGYGSYFEGHPNPYSDVDFFFIPANPDGYKAMRTFIIEEIGYDFWPISWERIAEFANFNEPLVSLLMDGVVLYSRNEEVLARYQAFRTQAKDHLESKYYGFLRWKATRYVDRAKALCFRLFDEDASFNSIRTHCINLYSELLNALALLNHTYVKKGGERFHHELARCEIVPEGFAESYDALLKTDSVDEMKNTSIAMVTKVEKLVDDFYPEPEDLNLELKGFFEEMKSTYNKVYHGVESNNTLKSFYGANSLDTVTKEFLGEKTKTYGFPILTDYVDDLIVLHQKTQEHEALWLKILEELKVDVVRYDNVEAFVEAMKSE